MSRDRLRMGLVMGLLIGMCSGLLAAEQHFTARFTSTWGLSLKCHDMVFSPDGKLLAVSPASGRLALVRTRDGQIDREFDFNPFSMGFTRDGQRLYGVSEQARRIIDIATGSEETVRTTLPVGFIGMNVVRQNGKIVISSITPEGPLAKLDKVKVGDELCGIGQSQTGEIVSVVGASPDKVRELLRKPAGTYLRLSVIPQGQLTPETFTLRREFAANRGGSLIFSAAWKPNLNETLVWCRFDGCPTLSDASSGEFVSCFNTVTIDFDEHSGLHALSPNQRHCAMVSRKKANWDVFGIEVFNLETQEAEAIISFAKEGFNAISFSADGKRLFVSTGLRVEVIDIASRRTIQTLADIRPNKLSNSPALRPSTPINAGSASQAAVLASGDRNASGVGQNEFVSKARLTALAVSRQGVLAIGNEVGGVRLIDPATDETLKTINAAGPHPVEILRFSNDGAKLAYFTNATLHLVDVSDVKIPDEPDQKSK